jgi:excisionase family DNA binding protein
MEDAPLKPTAENIVTKVYIDMAIRVTGYTKSTIYKLVNLREIPHSKRRGKLRFDEKALREWRKGRPRETAEEAKKNT